MSWQDPLGALLSWVLVKETLPYDALSPPRASVAVFCSGLSNTQMIGFLLCEGNFHMLIS